MRIPRVFCRRQSALFSSAVTKPFSDSAFSRSVRETKATQQPSEGGRKVGEKNCPSFPGFSRAIFILFQRLSQQKVYVIMTFIYQRSFHINYTTHVTNKGLSSHIAQINSFRAQDTLLNTGCTRSASVFPEIAQNSLDENSMSFPCSEKCLSVPVFPGLWPPCFGCSAKTRG